MSLRMTLTAALGLALALPALVAANPNGKRGESASKAAPVTRVVYPVTDLVVPIDYHDGKSCERTDEVRLMELIKATVAPKSWKDQGGTGSLQYYPIGMSLIVNQSREVQAEVADLLAALRRLQDIEVAVEVRIVTLSPEMAARFRLNAGFEASKLDAIEEFVGTMTFGEALGVNKAPKVEKPASAVDVAFLTEKQLYPWFALFQTDPVTNIMCAPKFTMANGQRGSTALPGLNYSLLPTVSADRRSLLVHVDLRLEQPKTEGIAFKQTNVVPDGRTMAVSLGKVMVDAPNESDVPVLSKIPYINRLFRNVGHSSEAREVFLFITPRVIIDGESEQISVNMPRESFMIELPPIPRP